jgi:hypothetical protein
MNFYMHTTLGKSLAHTASSVITRRIPATASDVYFNYIYPLPNLTRFRAKYRVTVLRRRTLSQSKNHGIALYPNEV